MIGPDLLLKSSAPIKNAWAIAITTPWYSKHFPNKMGLFFITFSGSDIKEKADIEVSIIPKLKLMAKWFLFATYLTIICAHAHPNVNPIIPNATNDLNIKSSVL